MCRTRAWWVLGAVTLGGCGSSQYDLVPVSGTVTLDSQPVVGARVVFEPTRTGKEALHAGPGSWGKTDEEGHFRLETMNEEDGAVVGLHSVTISTYEAEVDRTREQSRVVRHEVIPEKYRQPGTLQFDVPAKGTEQAVFSLESP